MEVCLLSRRGGAGDHWSQHLARAAAEALVSAGHAVRWLCALTPDAAMPTAAAPVELVPLRGRMRPFRQVHGRLCDTPLDVALSRTLRARPADIVHDVGFGAPGSAGALWLAQRMGATCLATVRAAEVLCHRQTLVDERQRDCRAFTDPGRCTACCLTPGSSALSPAAAATGRALRWLGGRSPFPNAHAFTTRLDVVIAGLGSASLVLVEDPAEAELLTTAGIHERALRSGDLQAAHGTALARTYADLLSG